MIYQQTLQQQTSGRGTTNITRSVADILKKSAISTGMLNIFLQHTSASLILCENADPNVRADLESFMKKITPDGDSRYRHTDEGPDDMSAHVRTILTGSSLNIPFNNQQLLLGTWQGIFLWEHRTHPHNRTLTVTVYGE
jgi:secondary thiamine-phosphate synthase enzyme